ncbi:hypothetical protein GJAV_G00097550 [Gymnothorax javanicus]|nr:hypothetical protein GJAV_G00097550 [Gymnothorax javanicus]
MRPSGDPTSPRDPTVLTSHGKMAKREWRATTSQMNFSEASLLQLCYQNVKLDTAEVGHAVTIHSILKSQKTLASFPALPNQAN